MVMMNQHKYLQEDRFVASIITHEVLPVVLTSRPQATAHLRSVKAPLITIMGFAEEEQRLFKGIIEWPIR